MTREERDPQHYEICVRGRLGPKMLRAFPAMAAQPRGEDTLLRGCLQDQSAVYGMIAKLEALGLELLELRRLPSARGGGEPVEAGEPGSSRTRGMRWRA